MRYLVTGAAGFIGSHLCERLLGTGSDVVGIDCFTDYYSRDIKERNLSQSLANDNFSFISENLLDLDLANTLVDVDVVFHLAAQAGVRASWGSDFKIYNDYNILATQKLLEAAKGRDLKKFIYASSSSVYGDTSDLPMREESVLKPISPYGVSKLAGENLTYLYDKNFGIPTISLRYFTVYGPRQRPDMAFNRFITAVLTGEKITLYGDGTQTRDFTYITDIIDAMINAAASDVTGEIVNLGGGDTINMNEVIKLIESGCGKGAVIDHQPKQHGDVMHTHASIQKAKDMLQYSPKVKVQEGIIHEINWLKETINADR